MVKTTQHKNKYAERETRITHLEQDAYAKIHKRLRKVDNHFTSVVDRHRPDGQIGFLLGKKNGTRNS